MKISGDVTWQALEVLKHFEVMPEAQDSEFYLSTYFNGRERGFTIRCFNTIICWAEYRSSDEIVIYHAIGYDNVQKFGEGNMPSEVAYEAKEFFPQGQFEEAANRIKELAHQGATIDAREQGQPEPLPFDGDRRRDGGVEVAQGDI